MARYSLARITNLPSAARSVWLITSATQDEVVTIGADDSVDEALRTMTEKKVRRLPVIDGHRLIGVVSQADLAKDLDRSKVGELVRAISAAP
jgi:CBS domain-containing protein